MEKDIRATSEEIAAIRAYGTKHANRYRTGGRLRFEIAERCHDDGQGDPHMNIALVDTTPDWEESDLFDLRPWAEIRKPIAAATGGRAAFDFYIYDDGGLVCNVQAFFEGGRLVRLEADGHDVTPYGDNGPAPAPTAALEGDDDGRTTYRLQSAPMCHTPGIVAWAINGAAFESDRPQMIKVIEEGYGIPHDAAAALVTGAAPYTVDGETVIFTH